MRLCRFSPPEGGVRPGLSLDGQTVLDLSVLGVPDTTHVLESEDPLRMLEGCAEHTGRAYRLADVRLGAPVIRQEIWAAGVTYLRSRTARAEESTRDATVYERVYEAARPELFFKGLGEKVVGPGDRIGIRRDARWSVPEPELALVFNSRGGWVGATIGNDVSSRDLEGENPLYLPQAKVYSRSCALGPWIVLGKTEAQLRGGTVRLGILRGGQPVYEGETQLDNLRRSFECLREFLFRSQEFPHGVVLLTGTGIVPPAEFTLKAGDVVCIEITGLGRLENPVCEV